MSGVSADALRGRAQKSLCGILERARDAPCPFFLPGCLRHQILAHFDLDMRQTEAGQAARQARTRMIDRDDESRARLAPLIHERRRILGAEQPEPAAAGNITMPGMQIT